MCTLSVELTSSQSEFCPETELSPVRVSPAWKVTCALYRVYENEIQ